MELGSPLFQGNSGKTKVEKTFLECGNCNSLYDRARIYCIECDSKFHSSKEKTESVDAAVCESCGEIIPYTRDNRVNQNYEIYGYICDSCENILELRFDSNLIDPRIFLTNDLGEDFKAVPNDSVRRSKIMWMFSLATKVEDVGFWSYQPEQYNIWLASYESVFCGYVSLNNQNILNQIWVDPAFRRDGVATKLVKHISKNVLKSTDELTISQPTEVGREFFESLGNDGEVFGKTLFTSY